MRARVDLVFLCVFANAARIDDVAFQSVSTNDAVTHPHRCKKHHIPRGTSPIRSSGGGSSVEGDVAPVLPSTSLLLSSLHSDPMSPAAEAMPPPPRLAAGSIGSAGDSPPVAVWDGVLRVLDGAPAPQTADFAPAAQGGANGGLDDDVGVLAGTSSADERSDDFSDARDMTHSSLGKPRQEESNIVAPSSGVDSYNQMPNIVSSTRAQVWENANSIGGRSSTKRRPRRAQKMRLTRRRWTRGKRGARKGRKCQRSRRKPGAFRGRTQRDNSEDPQLDFYRTPKGAREGGDGGGGGDRGSNGTSSPVNGGGGIVHSSGSRGYISASRVGKTNATVAPANTPKSPMNRQPTDTLPSRVPLTQPARNPKVARGSTHGVIMRKDIGLEAATAASESESGGEAVTSDVASSEKRKHELVGSSSSSATPEASAPPASAYSRDKRSSASTSSMPSEERPRRLQEEQPSSASAISRFVNAVRKALNAFEGGTDVAKLVKKSEGQVIEGAQPGDSDVASRTHAFDKVHTNSDATQKNKLHRTESGVASRNPESANTSRTSELGDTADQDQPEPIVDGQSYRFDSEDSVSKTAA
eukprot:TRINITY_DN12756_c0_g1_i1.p1 TRINITY_DN12756_c0_g1~~TRINITY_DN12756_c0_g1_i1.p1  ORF type:complete len:584 (+),score=86.55 TRINITY_DN12756_c0_g1_i1:104-1855(+)